LENEKYALKIFYLGYKYYGFVVQKNVPTIEGFLREVVREALQDRRIHITYSSRTDKGVHALGQTITVNLDKPDIDQLNMKIPEEISIWAYCKAPKNFDARRSTIYRHYKYVTPYKNLDIESMNRVAKSLIGIHDFRRFCYKISGPVIRRIYYIKIGKTEDGYITMEFIGSKFARGLIRNLVTLLIDVGSGKLKDIDIWNFNGEIYMSPPENLYLVNSYYPLNYKISNLGVEKVIKALDKSMREMPEKKYILSEMKKDFEKLLNEIKENDVN